MGTFKYIEKSWRYYHDAVLKAPMLTKAKEVMLAKLWQDNNDEKALKELVMSYARYAVKIAYDFRNYGLSVSDLIQEANIGLLEAASRFDPKKDVRFSSYAIWWIRSAIQEHILRYSSIVRVSTTSAQKSLFFKFKSMFNDIKNDDCQSLDDSQRMSISKTLKVPFDAVKRMEAYTSNKDLSLNTKINDTGQQEHQDMLVSSQPTCEENIIESNLQDFRKKCLKYALRILNEKEKLIINFRFLDEHKKTLAEIGKMLGLTKERVRQIELKALSKLKQALSLPNFNPQENF